MDKIILPHEHSNVSDGLQHSMPSSQSFEVIAEIFKILSDAKRAQLFWILCHCEECVINLSALIELSSSAVSHHLKLLKTTGFIVSRRAGKEVYYTAADTQKASILHQMIEQILEVSCPVESTPIDLHSYDANVHIITQIHALLTGDIRSRYTIEQLAERFSMNQTTLKTTFKTIYGKPIAAYMKEYRVKQAKELLVQTDCPISQIAQAVGYENQSKFTQAFKDVTGILPKDYRKQADRPVPHSFHP